MSFKKYLKEKMLNEDFTINEQNWKDKIEKLAKSDDLIQHSVLVFDLDDEMNEEMLVFSYPKQNSRPIIYLVFTYDNNKEDFRTSIWAEGDEINSDSYLIRSLKNVRSVPLVITKYKKWIEDGSLFDSIYNED